MSGCPYSHKSLPAFGDNSLMSLMVSFAKVIVQDPTEVIHAVSRASAGSDRTFINFGVKKFHILKHPDDINSVYIENADACPISRLRTASSSYRDGIKLGNTSHTPEVWKEHRAAFSNHVGPKGLKHNYREAVEAVLPVIANWGSHNRFIVDRETTKIAAHYAWAAFFSSNLTDLQAEKIADVGDDDLQRFFLLTFLTNGKLPPEIIRKISNVQNFNDTLDEILNPVIDKRLALTPEQWPNDFLSTALKNNKLDIDPANLTSRDQVLCELAEILIASYISVRTTLYWALHNLSTRPDLQNRIRTEIREGTTGTVEAVTNDTLRLYPSSYLFLRETSRDIALKGDYSIPAKSYVMIPVFDIHRDPRWWPDPGNFNPDENFSPAANNNRPRNAFLPFGLGRHKCPGFATATQEINTLLAAICTAYEIRPDPNGVKPYLSASTLLNPERESTLIAALRSGAKMPGAEEACLNFNY